MLHIRLFGNFLVTDQHNRAVGLTRPQLKTLLAYLALHRQASLSKADLAKLFWRPTLGDQPAANLRNLLHYLRQELPALADCIDFGKTVRWKADAPYCFDVAAFEGALEQAVATTDPLAQQAALVKALTYYTGELWPQCQEEWIFPIRERLRNLYITALEQLIGLLEGGRDYPGALAAAQRLLHDTPLREESYRRVMQLQAALGDHDGIERTFAECRHQLQRKWKIAPSAPTRELYDRLTQTTTCAAHQPLPFVERQAEWAHLQQRWAAAQQGQPHCCLLTGDPGIGKSRLLTEFVASLERQGLPVVVAHCQPYTLTMDYMPLLAWLATPLLRRRLATLAPARRADLAFLLPDLADAQTAPVAAAPPESRQRQRLYDTLAHLFLAADEPILLALDNAQWCDQETLAWLHYLLGAMPTAKLLIVGAFSHLELRPHDPVARLQPRLQRSRLVTELPLGPLTQAGVAQLGQALTGRPLPVPVAASLYQATAGNPCYVSEALQTIPLDDVTLQSPVRIAHLLLTLPVVQATVQPFLAALSAGAQEVMGLAAVIGGVFSFALLAAVALTSHETLLLALDELLQQAILLDAEDDGYTFRHFLLQQAAYASLSSAKRRLWQQRVAQARQQLNLP